MAFMISLKEDGRVFLATESVQLQTEANQALEINRRIWVPKGCKETILVASGGMSRVTFLRSMRNLITSEEDISPHYISNCVITHIINDARKAQVCDANEKLEDLSLALLIANKEEAYFIGSKGGCRAVEDIDAFSENGAYIKAMLKELSHLDPVTRILVTAYYYQETEVPLTFPLVIMDTKTMEPHLYYWQDLTNAVNKFKGGNK